LALKPNLFIFAKLENMSGETIANREKSSVDFQPQKNRFLSRKSKKIVLRDVLGFFYRTIRISWKFIFMWLVGALKKGTFSLATAETQVVHVMQLQVCSESASLAATHTQTRIHKHTHTPAQGVGITFFCLCTQS